MKSRRILLIGMALSSTAVGMLSVTRGQSGSARVAEASTPELLAGIKDVELHVTVLGDEKPAGVRLDKLRTKIELRLREMGIETISMVESTRRLMNSGKSTPALDIRLSVSKVATEGVVLGHTYRASVDMLESVWLNRKPDTLVPNATTWSRVESGWLGQLRPKQEFYDAVLSIIDDFGNDWQKSNSKP